MNKFFVTVLSIIFSASIVCAVEIDIKFYQFTGTYSGDQEVTNLSWNFTPETIDYGVSTSQWKISNIYAVLKGTKTDSANQKVYLYTNNKNNSSPYKAENPRYELQEGESFNRDKYNGLVRANSKGGNNNFAPIKYRIYMKGLDLLPTNIEKVDLSGYKGGDSGYGSRWLTDINDYEYKNEIDKFKTYAQIVSNKGIWCGNGIWEEYFEYYDAVIFFGALFTCVGGEDFKTETIMFVYEEE